MAIIEPSLFLIQQRLPDYKDDLRRLYLASKSFQTICQSYQECSRALDYWSESKNNIAPLRQREYSKLMKELEEEILQSLKEGR